MVYDPSGMGSIVSFTNKGYSNEALRAQIFCDLIHMAFVCDLARAATLMVTSFQSQMNMTDPIGITDTLHNIGHSYGSAEVAKGIAWNLKPFAYLTAKMSDTPDGDGTLLDHSAMVFLFEGGHGYNPEGDVVKGGTHSSENMTCLIAGRAGGLKPGQHVVATGMHPANVLLSGMTAIGVPNGNALGEVNGTIQALFT
jgi:hypothetical protein